MYVPQSFRKAPANEKSVIDLLQDPLSAFEAAWRYRRRMPFTEFGCPEFSVVLFAAALNRSCLVADIDELPGPELAGNPSEALDQFLIVTARLLDSWMALRDAEDPVLRWVYANKSQFVQMQRAQRALVQWTTRPGFFTESAQNQHSPLIALRKLRGQKSFRQAARTAAYLVWGEFLSGDRSRITFCEKCGRPFAFRPSKKFCQTVCGKGVAANKVHKAETRTENWKRLQSASSELRKRLEQGRRKNPTEGIETPRWLTRFVRVAVDPSDVCGREHLIELCTDPAAENPGHRQEVRFVFGQFLEDLAITVTGFGAKEK